jgi:RNA 3'-terminal phosphate cyclase (ATP)
MEFLSIDGLLGEGGGSITRLAAGFSVLFNKPIHLINIRSSRNPPGLRLQHQLGLESLQKLSNGQLSSIEVGTTDLTFEPGPGGNHSLTIPIRTAGSIALLSQTIQTAFIHHPKAVPLTINFTGGGTYGMGAPDPYYLNNVTYHLFSKMGYSCHLDVKKNGFYPKGGASAILNVQPVKNLDQIQPLVLEHTGELLGIGGFIACSDNLQKPRVGERIRTSVIENLKKNSYFAQIHGEAFKITTHYERTLNPGVGLSIWAIYEKTVIGTGTILGKRGVSSEMVGKTAANMLIKETAQNATVDSYAADQLVPLLVLCPKYSKICINDPTSHLKTNIELLDQFHPRIHSLKKNGNLWNLEYQDMN